MECGVTETYQDTVVSFATNEVSASVFSLLRILRNSRRVLTATKSLKNVQGNH